MPIFMRKHEKLPKNLLKTYCGGAKINRDAVLLFAQKNNMFFGRNHK